MDKFRAKQQSECGVGGIKCSCCNMYHDKDKHLLNKIARTQLKVEDKREIESIDPSDLVTIQGLTYEMSISDGEDKHITEKQWLDGMSDDILEFNANEEFYDKEKSNSSAE
jgi:hypothetical protein